MIMIVIVIMMLIVVYDDFDKEVQKISKESKRDNWEEKSKDTPCEHSQ